MSVSSINEPINRIREACFARGSTGLRDLGRMFNLYDEVRGGIGGRRRVSLAEIGHVLRILGVRVPDVQMVCLCQHLSRGGRDGENHPRQAQTSEVILDDLFNAIRPCLSQTRANLIEAVYRRIDGNGDGVISLGDFEEAYDFEKNPKFLNGDWSRDQVMQAFVDDFLYPGAYYAGIDPLQRVSKHEFIDYYLGLSAFVDRDIEFDYIVRSQWKL